MRKHLRDGRPYCSFWILPSRNRRFIAVLKSFLARLVAPTYVRTNGIFDRTTEAAYGSSSWLVPLADELPEHLLAVLIRVADDLAAVDNPAPVVPQT